LDGDEVVVIVCELCDLGEVYGVVVDVSDVDGVFIFVWLVVVVFGGFDVLVGNVGMVWCELFLEIMLEYWDCMLVVNLCGMFFVV